MLILTRRRGQTIRVGEDITFTVLNVAGEQVRIGVTAPRHITVDREEVYERKRLGGWSEEKPSPHGRGEREQNPSPRPSPHGRGEREPKPARSGG